jgi:prephenate dehydrogenase
MAEDVIGMIGYGRFGRALGQLLAEGGVPHRAYDPHAVVPDDVAAHSLASLVEGATFVVLAVPVPQMRAAAAELRPHLRPSQIVFDVGSVKVRPAAALREALGDGVAWCGTHPLFGPVSLARAERPMRAVLCPAPAHLAAAAEVRRLFERIGCEVIEQTPDGHDRVMALTHALTFFVAKGMLDVGAGGEVPFAPPSFQAIARTIETVRSDGGHLFQAIARDNPFASEARKHLIQALGDIDRALDAQAAEGPEATGDVGPLAIPDLGQHSPELKQARDTIDSIDHQLVALLAQRSQLQQRAARAKAAMGAPVLDAARESDMMATRRGWANEQKLDVDGVMEVFRAVLVMSRRAQSA